VGIVVAIKGIEEIETPGRRKPGSPTNGRAHEREKKYLRAAYPWRKKEKRGTSFWGKTAQGTQEPPRLPIYERGGQGSYKFTHGQGKRLTTQPKWGGAKREGTNFAHRIRYF